MFFFVVKKNIFSDTYMFFFVLKKAYLILKKNLKIRHIYACAYVLAVACLDMK